MIPAMREAPLRIFRVHDQPADALSHAVRQVFLGRTVQSCGVAHFAPGVCAHERERHVHDHDEVFVILAGEITVPIVGGPADVARAGHLALVEAAKEHHLTNHTSLPCVALYLILAK